ALHPPLVGLGGSRGAGHPGSPSEARGCAAGVGRDSLCVRNTDPARHRHGDDQCRAMAGSDAPVGRGAARCRNRMGRTRRGAPSVSAVFWSTFANEADAERAANTLLDEGLIACANLIPGVRSTYRWNGEKGEDREVATLFKTDARLLDKAVAGLSELHRYETP